MNALSVDDAMGLGLNDTGFSLRKAARRVAKVAKRAAPIARVVAPVAKRAAPIARVVAPMAMQAVPYAPQALAVMRQAAPVLHTLSPYVPIPGLASVAEANQQALDFADRTGAAAIPGLTTPDPLAAAAIPRLLSRRVLGASAPALPMGPLVVARTLMQDPASRRLIVRELARRCGVHLHDARKGVGSLLEAMQRGDAGDLRPDPHAERIVGSDDTFDELMSRMGGAAPPGGMGRREAGAMPAPVRFRMLSVKDADRLFALARVPTATRLKIMPLVNLQGQKDARGLTPDGGSYVTEKGDLGSTIAQKLTGNAGRWKELADANPSTKDAQYGMKFGPGTILKLPASWVKTPAVPPGVPPVSPPTPGVPLPTVPATGGGRPLPPGAYWAAGGALRYKMQAGDVTAEIMATKFGFPGDGQALVNVNKSAPWGKLPVGYDLATPPSWASSFARTENTNPPISPVTPPAPPVSPPPGLPPVAPPVSPPVAPPPGPPIAPPGYLNTGGQLQVKVMLAAWGLKNPTLIQPVDYGSNPADVSPTWDMRTKAACAAFQRFTNDTKKLGLRTDGELDQPTYDALTAWTYTTINANVPPGTPPVPVPGVPGIPASVPPVDVSIGEKKSEIAVPLIALAAAVLSM